MFYDTLNELCKKNGISITSLMQVLNMSSGNLSKWKKGGMPKYDTLKRISEYFNVSTDYLLGKTDQKTPSSSKREGALEEVYRIFSSLDPENQAKLLELSRLYLEHQEQRQSKKEKGPAPDDGGET